MHHRTNVSQAQRGQYNTTDTFECHYKRFANTFGASVDDLRHLHDQNDDWFMHAITCIDELQHGSLIRTREPMNDEHWTSGMPANDIDRGGPQPLVAAEGKHQHLLLLLLTSLLILLIGITRGENCELRERRF